VAVGEIAPRDARTTNGARPLRVLFAHPAFPNQFTALGAELNRDPAFECYGLTHQGAAPLVAASPGAMPHFGFWPDGQITASTYPYLQLYETGLRNALGMARTLMAVRNRYRFDAVIGHAGFGGTLFTREVLDCATISYVELSGYQAAAARPEFPLSPEVVFATGPFESLLYASVVKSDLCIVPSDYARRQLPPELQAKARVQMEGFDVEHIPPGGPAERATLGLPADAKLVGFFGRTLEAVRGFDIFVRAARRLHELDGTLQFVVIGDETTIYGNEMRYTGGRSFKEYALAQAGVPESLFHWRRSMPYDLFRRHIACLDLAVLPLFDGAGNWSLFEAMAVGLPILSSNHCFVPEIIRNGKEGILLEPYDVNGFVEQAVQLLRDPPRAYALGQAALARIRRKYTLSNAASGYRRIILEALDRHRRHARANSK
jgi:glycosyltransferase involved in cell wall biosynthesis